MNKFNILILTILMHLSQAYASEIPMPRRGITCNLIETKVKRLDLTNLTEIPIIHQENIKAYFAQSKNMPKDNIINIQYLDYTIIFNMFFPFQLTNHPLTSHYTVIYNQMPCQGKCLGAIAYKVDGKLEVLEFSYRKTFLRNANVNVSLIGNHGLNIVPHKGGRKFKESDHYEGESIYKVHKNQVYRNLHSLGFLNKDETKIMFMTDIIRYPSKYSLAKFGEYLNKKIKIPAEYIETKAIMQDFKPYNFNLPISNAEEEAFKPMGCLFADMSESKTKKDITTNTSDYTHALNRTNSNSRIRIIH